MLDVSPIGMFSIPGWNVAEIALYAFRGYVEFGCEHPESSYSVQSFPLRFVRDHGNINNL